MGAERAPAGGGWRRALGGQALTLVAPLRARDFRLLWAGQAIAGVGDRLFPFAVAFLALDAGRGATGVAIVLGAHALALALVGLSGGLLAGRFSQRRTMVRAAFARTVLVVTLALIPASAPVLLLGVPVLLVGACEAVFRPAHDAAVRATLPDRLLAAGEELRSVTLRAAGLLGIVLAWVLVSVAGARVALLADAGVFLASLAAVAAMNDPGAARGSAGRALMPAAAAGLRAVLELRWAAVVALAATVLAVLAVTPWTILLPVVSYERLGGSAAYGALLLLFAGGAVGGAQVTERVRAALPGPPGLAAALGALPFAVALAGLAVPLPLALLLLLAAAAGAGLGLAGRLWRTALGEELPEDARGGVAAAERVATLALAPPAFVLAGAAATLVGGRPVLLAAAAIAVAASGLPLLHAGVRRLSSVAPEPEPEALEEPEELEAPEEPAQPPPGPGGPTSPARGEGPTG